ncbi:Lcb4 sphingosine kinase [Candida orthopsilosis Co 90-125]|uniref:Lcb4 sphingosine kinase n=1 Tax=Candida orthopsilosis (strain 90-125) TaxID=1136231 RepID=H8WXU0_CANO9|nr:Lcb4 sphingosine kinase [Candida orthopsilosis Co 90-125]CCG20887.1 Lcb4 sphingosine kinase [Candida orthopsilosis Co 90-125]
MPSLIQFFIRPIDVFFKRLYSSISQLFDMIASSSSLNRKLSSEQLLYRKKDLINVTLASQGIVIGSLRSQGIEQQNGQVLESNDDSEDLENADTSSGLMRLCNSCFGGKSISSDTKIPQFISYKNILHTEALGSEENHEVKLTFVTPDHDDYLKKASKLSIHTIKVQVQNYDIQKHSSETITSYIQNKAYHYKVLQQPSVLVLINPHGGQGNALKIYNGDIKPILQAARCKITYQETNYSGHATDIARGLNIDDYDVILCCSGDGIPHEVINGFYRRKDYGVAAFNKLIITQLPCGSGNALSLSTLGGSGATQIATWLMLKSKPSKLDLMAVTQGTGDKQVTKLSFLSQCYGIVADSDIGTEHLRWLGAIRFEIGVMQKVFTFAKYPCDLYVEAWTKDKSLIAQHVESHLANTNNGNNNSDLRVVTQEDLKLRQPSLDEPVPSHWKTVPQSITEKLNVFYVGNMPYVSADAQFFPAALPDDGHMDMVITDTNASILNIVSIMMNVEKGTHVNDENVIHAKVKSYRLVPRLKSTDNHYISVDGESFPVEALQVEVLPSIMTGLLYDGKFTETVLTE